MKLPIVSFDVAKLLKEIGFDIYVKLAYHKAKTDSRYWDIKKGDVALDPGFSKDFNTLNDEFWETISAPTLALVQMWLREVYDIHCNILYCPVNKHYDVWYDLVSGAPGDSFKSHEEALEQCILKAIKLIKTKQDDI